jgi:hypothetical protein
MSSRKTAPVGGSMATRGVPKRVAPDFVQLSRGLESTYRRKMHLVEDNEKSFANVSEVAGNSRIKM